MSQETFNRRLYVLLAVLSIAVGLIAAGFYAAVVVGTLNAKSLNTVLPEKNEDHTLSVSGSASISIIPDTASMSLGVLTQAATAQEASEKNAVAMTAVITVVKNLGLQDKDIRTSFLSIQPVYNYPKDNGVPTIVGYLASNNVQITTKMLDKLSEIVDKSVAAGANQIGGVSFIVSEEKQKQFRDELLANAVADASTKANKLADSLKVKIVGVKTVSISEGGFPLPFLGAPSRAEKAATPVLPGESQVTFSVQITYILE